MYRFVLALIKDVLVRVHVSAYMFMVSASSQMAVALKIIIDRSIVIQTSNRYPRINNRFSPNKKIFFLAVRLHPSLFYLSQEPHASLTRDQEEVLSHVD